MTKNYALFLLNQLCVGASVDVMPIIPQFELAQALSVAIKALEQEPCEDCISRKAVKEQMIKYGFKAPDMTVTEFVEDCLPSVTPTRPTGKWIDIQYFKADDTYYRPKCPFCSIEPKSIAISALTVGQEWQKVRRTHDK